MNTIHRNPARRRILAVSVIAVVGTFHAIQIHAQDREAREAPQVLAPINESALEHQASFDSFIVRFSEHARVANDPQVLESALQIAAAAMKVEVSVERRLAIGADVVRINGKHADARMARDLMRGFAALPNVEYVEPNAMMTIALTPNDTRYNEQWHYFETTGGLNLPAAWDIGSGTGVTVAVLDTGITSHTDLSANVVAGYDFVSSATNARDGNGRDSNPQDEGDWWTNSECGTGAPPSQNSSWHGTHVAGTVAALTNNASGVAGVGFGAKIQPVRVLAKCGGSLADIADGIVWASGGTVTGVPANPTPAKVINMSLGGGGACGTTYQSAIDAAVARGTVVIVAAGNSNTNASNSRPANCNNVVAVAATNRAGGRSYYSNYGTVVDVAAPGGETNSVSSNGVLSTLNAGTTTPGAQSYAFYQGTSMATPHVAGLAAMILSKGSFTPAQVETYLKNNTRPLPVACSLGCGTGIVDSLKTMQAVTGGTQPSFFQNLTDYPIADHSTVESPIVVSGRTGNASSALKVAVRIIHTYIGDLKVDLVAPNGTIFVLHNRTGGGTDNIITTYTVNASAIVANGTWRLRVNDNATADTGYIDSWSLQF